MPHETSRDLEMNLWGTEVTIPQGTRVREVKGASGTEGDLWAVESATLLVNLTGNAHDPLYRWAFVPTDAVRETEAAPSLPAARP